VPSSDCVLVVLTGECGVCVGPSLSFNHDAKQVIDHLASFQFVVGQLNNLFLIDTPYSKDRPSSQ
jgi:hypothetical protein